MSLRDLIWMWYGKEFAAWSRASRLEALLININRDPKKRAAVHPKQLHPLLPQRKRVKAQPGSIMALKQLAMQEEKL